MSKSIVIVPLGRFNPPHKEHAHLVDAVIKLAKSTHSDAKVFVSRTVNKKKDPLTPQEKIRFLNKMFPGQKKLFDVPPISNPSMVGVLKSLSGKYDTVHIVLGDDRVAEIKAFVDKYNGTDYNYDKIEVHSRHSIVNTRVGDLDGVHASDIRKWAMAGNFAKVRDAMSEHLTDADVKQMVRIIQSRLGKTMNESVVVEEEIPLPTDAEIDRYLDKLTDMSELDLRDEDAMMLDMITDEDSQDVQEGLTSQQRQKRSQKMKSMSKRLARLRKLKSKQMPTGQRLRLRARKAAIMILRARASGRKNLDYNALSRSQRISVDNALTQRFGKSLKGAINRIATRILPRIRSKAQASVAQARSSTNEAFHMFLEGKEGSAKDRATDIKQAKAKKISVPDWEKSKADVAHDSPLHIDATKIVATDVDPTTVDRSAPNPKHTTHGGGKRLSQFRLRTEARSSAADAVDAGDTNIIYQMRKAIIARGEHEVVFGDKHKVKISVVDARKMLDLFDRTRLPADKQKLTVAASKSLTAFRSVLSHGIPKDKPKISLGGRKLDEVSFNARNWNPNDSDAPPGITQANEKKKPSVKEDSEDPNQSRRLNQKMDVLLRLGLVDTTELQGYRRALRSSKQFALQSPQLRKNLADLLDKLIDLTTQDPATYSRVRYNVVNKELDSQPNPDLRKKAKKSGMAEDVLNQVFAREMAESNNVSRAYNRVDSFIAGGFAAKLDEDLAEDGGYKSPTGGLTQKGRDRYNRETGGNLQAPVTTPPSKLKAGSKAAGRRKSFCARMSGVDGPMKKPNGKPTRKALALRKWNCRSEETQVDEKCWTGYKQIGMKNKGGKPVPNCVPEDVTDRHASHKVIRVKDGNNFTYRKVYEEPISIAKYSVAKPVVGDAADGPDKVTKTPANFKEVRKALAGIRESYDLNESFSAGFTLTPFARDYGMTIETAFHHHPDVQNAIDEAEYQGKTVPLNKPMKGDVKKSKVYVDPDGDGKAKKVNFGDKNLSIKKDQPPRKKSYCARSGGQGNLTNKSSANYWSRRAWDC